MSLTLSYFAYAQAVARALLAEAPRGHVADFGQRAERGAITTFGWEQGSNPAAIALTILENEGVPMPILDSGWTG